MTTVEWEAVPRTDIPRDRWGRPLVIPPGARTKRVAYRRTTTFVGVLEDTSALAQWKARMVALGMGQRPDLVLAAAAADPTDKTTLRDIAEKAAEHAGSSAAATTGTALHALTERIDRGLELGAVPNDYVADLRAYEEATRGIEWLGVETFRVHDDWQVAGTADRIGIYRGRRVVLDIKTGSIEYGVLKMAMQLAMYAHMTPYDVATDRRGEPEGLDPNLGIIIHLPAGEGRCTLHEVDLGKGWGACQLAREVWHWRQTKGIMRPVDAPRTDTWSRSNSPLPPPTWESLIEAADSVEALRNVWQQAAGLGQLTDELRALCVERSKKLSA